MLALKTCQRHHQSLPLLLLFKDTNSFVSKRELMKLTYLALINASLAWRNFSTTKTRFVSTANSAYLVILIQVIVGASIVRSTRFNFSNKFVTMKNIFYNSAIVTSNEIATYWSLACQTFLSPIDSDVRTGTDNAHSAGPLNLIHMVVSKGFRTISPIMRLSFV